VSSDPVLADLVSGLLNTQWLILEMLDRKGITARGEVIAEFEAALEILQAPPAAPSSQTMPLLHLIRALSGSSSQGPKSGAWTPIVIPPSVLARAPTDLAQPFRLDEATPYGTRTLENGRQRLD
jgi:hypothetical protein